MIVTAVLLLAASTATPPPRRGATATAVAHARILAPAEVRRIDERLVVRTGGGKAPTQMHRTRRPDGGATVDFY